MEGEEGEKEEARRRSAHFMSQSRQILHVRVCKVLQEHVFTQDCHSSIATALGNPSLLPTSLVPPPLVTAQQYHTCPET